MSPWKLYDDLICAIPENISVSSCSVGHNWTVVISSEDGAGIAKTIDSCSVPYSYDGQMTGAPLRQIAELSKSWNFIEAAIGVAAIGAYYNHPSRVGSCGAEHPAASGGTKNVFDIYREAAVGRKVTVVGSFPALEERLGTVCELTVLERDPSSGELPDPACEYILGEQDMVLITGSALVNKTMPRLLELSKNAVAVVIGPSTIMASTMFEHGASGLSGMIVRDTRKCDILVREGNPPALFRAGEMANFVRM